MVKEDLKVIAQYYELYAFLWQRLKILVRYLDNELLDSFNILESVAVSILDWCHSGFSLKKIREIIVIINTHFVRNFDCR